MAWPDSLAEAWPGDVVQALNFAKMRMRGEERLEAQLNALVAHCTTIRRTEGGPPQGSSTRVPWQSFTARPAKKASDPRSLAKHAASLLKDLESNLKDPDPQAVFIGHLKRVLSLEWIAACIPGFWDAEWAHVKEINVKDLRRILRHCWSDVLQKGEIIAPREQTVEMFIESTKDALLQLEKIRHEQLEAKLHHGATVLVGNIVSWFATRTLKAERPGQEITEFQMRQFHDTLVGFGTEAFSLLILGNLGVHLTGHGMLFATEQFSSRARALLNAIDLNFRLPHHDLLERSYPNTMKEVLLALDKRKGRPDPSYAVSSANLGTGHHLFALAGHGHPAYVSRRKASFYRLTSA
ncbi:hypothetical protein ACM66B_001047 [Microbotryomycetes sp. NB124-2]